MRDSSDGEGTLVLAPESSLRVGTLDPLDAGTREWGEVAFRVWQGGRPIDRMDYKSSNRQRSERA